LGRAVDDARVRREARSLKAALRDEYRLDKLVAASPAMRDVFDIASRVADAATPVLLYGETGTGKTALARAIHATSARAASPFVLVTARRCRRRSSRPSCSGTSRAPSPARPRRAGGS